MEAQIARCRLNGAEMHSVERAFVPGKHERALKTFVDREGDHRDFAVGLSDAVAADRDAGHVAKFDGRHISVELMAVAGEGRLLALNRERVAHAGKVVEHRDALFVELAGGARHRIDFAVLSKDLDEDVIVDRAS